MAEATKIPAPSPAISAATALLVATRCKTGVPQWTNVSNSSDATVSKTVLIVRPSKTFLTKLSRCFATCAIETHASNCKSDAGYTDFPLDCGS